MTNSRLHAAIALGSALIDVVGAVRIRRTVPHPIQAASDSKEQLIASHTQCIRAQSRTR